MRLSPLLLPVLVATAQLAQAQQASPEQSGAAGQSNLDALATGAPAPLYLGRNDGVVGNPYVDARWLPGQLTTKNNTPLAVVPLKYDVFNHRILMRKHGTTDSLQLDDRYVTRFTLQVPAAGGMPARQRTFRRFTEAPLPNQSSDFVEVLHTGRYELLKHYVVRVRKAPAHTGYGVESKGAELEDKSEYFLRRPNAQLVPVKLTSKSILAAAPDLASALKSASPKTELEWTNALQLADPR